MDLRVQPLQLGRQLPLGRHRLRGAHLRERPQEWPDDELARLLVRVGQRQQNPDLHDPQGCQVDGRQAVDGGRRPLHVQPDQEVPGARPECVMGGAQERDAKGRPDRLPVQDPSRPLLLLHRRPDPDRPSARLVEDRESGHLQGSPPDRLGPVQDGPVLAAGHQVHEERWLLAEGQADDRDDLLPGLHLKRSGEPAARKRQGPVGQPVHPEHQVLLPKRELGQPLLVPTDGQRLGLHQPEGPDPEGRCRPEGDGVRDRPAEGLRGRRVRL